MQEIHSMGDTRFFGATADRRLRPHHHHNAAATTTNCHHHHQALKCPRCDSLNTKFCYYNNYNLSQPRHFCKNCRRYWTKGGVLRNVPVGGGCRKSKRSSNDNRTSKTTRTNSSATATATSSAETPPKTSSSQPPPADQNANSHSSSESSNLTAAATAATTGTTELNSDSSKLLIHDNNNNNNNASSNPNLESGGIFSEIGTFTSLMASSSLNNDALAFGFGGGGGRIVPDTTSFQWHHQQRKLPENLNDGGGGGSLLDHHGQGSTVTVDLSALESKTGHGGFGPLDWQSGVDQGLFDLPNTVDHAYWSQTQWSDHDNSNLFHLP